jgi:uncharacterized protein (DUF849 family)
VVPRAPSEIARSAVATNAAQAVAAHEGGRERADQTEQQQIDRHRDADRARDQPNSSCSGSMSTPGVERKPAAARRVKNATPNTTQA